MSGRFRIGCCAKTDEPNWRWVSNALVSAPSSTGSSTPAGEPSGDAIDWTLLEAVISENPDLYGKLKYKSA